MMVVIWLFASIRISAIVPSVVSSAAKSSDGDVVP